MKKRKIKKGNLKKKLHELKFKKHRAKLTKPVILDLIKKMMKMEEKSLKVSFQAGERKFLIESIYNEYKILNEDVSEIKTKMDLSQVIKKSYKRLDDNLKEILKNLGAVITCSKGCGYCCHQLIGVSFPSLSMIIPHIDKDSLEDAQKFVNDNRGFGKACIFLKDDSCSIYEDRPFPCRSYFSVKPAFECEETYVKGNKILKNNIPTLIFSYGQIIDSITDFVFDSYGYQRIYEKDMTKLILNYNEESLEKWLNKEPL